MDGEVIKSFLVGLGFGVDDASLKKFNDAIKSASIRVAALYGSINIAAAGIFKTISGVSQGFEDMGYQLRIVSPLVNRWLVMRQAMLQAYSKAGVNLTKVVGQAILFNYSLQKTKFALEAVYKSVAAKFFPVLTKQMDIFRGKIFANMPKIQKQLTKFVEFIFKAFQATVELGNRLWSILTRLWDFFVRLDKATNGWSTALLGIVAAWKLLNLSFLATPLGMLLAGFLAILTLFDDFKVWEEGGKSLFNWGPFLPVIDDAITLFRSLWDTVKSVTDSILQLFTAVYKLFNLDFSGALLAWGRAGDSIIATFQNLWSVLKNTGGLLGTVGGWAANLFSNANAQPALNSVAQPAPLRPANAGNTANVNQQTHITVNGAADANSVGKTVVGNQDRVNFDMTRNLKGAIK